MKESLDLCLPIKFVFGWAGILQYLGPGGADLCSRDITDYFLFHFRSLISQLQKLQSIINNTKTHRQVSARSTQTSTCLMVSIFSRPTRCDHENLRVLNSALITSSCIHIDIVFLIKCSMITSDDHVFHDRVFYGQVFHDLMFHDHKWCSSVPTKWLECSIIK